MHDFPNLTQYIAVRGVKGPGSEFTLKEEPIGFADRLDFFFPQMFQLPEESLKSRRGLVNVCRMSEVNMCINEVFK